MTQSVTGTGTGASGKPTYKDLATLINGPCILAAGRATTVDDNVALSPPGTAVVVTLTPPLPGSHTNYVVIVTSLNAGEMYVGNMSNNDDGDFNQFIVVSEAEGTCMYFVTKVGTRPTI